MLEQIKVTPTEAYQVLRYPSDGIAALVQPSVVRGGDLDTCTNLAAHLNSVDYLQGALAYRVVECNDPLGICNLSNLSQIELDELGRVFSLNEQWLEDVRDGLQLYQESLRLGIVWSDLELKERIYEPFDEPKVCYYCKGKGCDYCTMKTSDEIEIVPLEISPAQVIILGMLEKKESILDSKYSWRKE